MPLGVKALGTFPLKSSKRDPGLSDVPVTVAGVTLHPGDWVYADKGGCAAPVLLCVPVLLLLLLRHAAAVTARLARKLDTRPLMAAPLHTHLLCLLF